MQINIHIEDNYLLEPKAKLHISDLLYLIVNISNIYLPLVNAPILCISTVLKHVISFVAEAEFGATFLNAK
jgi:hypothetical protein